MVLDTSALLAILQDEPGRRRFTEAIEAAESCLLSVASFVEASIVVEARFGAEGVRDLDLLLERAGIEIGGVDAEQGRLARQAFSRYGKGRHEAGLNFGDCFAYALARALARPLLFQGGDFARTDTVAALPAAP
ncbi:MAG: type II toxin-antitoxin system VapC family toxin [Thermoanaerobaculia bacterium]